MTVFLQGRLFCFVFLFCWPREYLMRVLCRSPSTRLRQLVNNLLSDDIHYSGLVWTVHTDSRRGIAPTSLGAVNSLSPSIQQQHPVAFDAFVVRCTTLMDAAIAARPLFCNCFMSLANFFVSFFDSPLSSLLGTSWIRRDSDATIILALGRLLPTHARAHQLTPALMTSKQFVWFCHLI